MGHFLHMKIVVTLLLILTDPYDPDPSLSLTPIDPWTKARM